VVGLIRRGFLALSILAGAALPLALLRGADQHPGTDPARLAAIGPRMQQFVDSGAIAGAVTLVQRHGEMLHLNAVGMQNVEDKVPMKTDSIFQIMSMTKPITSAGIMMLLEEGRLDLYEKVETYLPEFHDQALRQPSGELIAPARPITIRDLLTHSSGMGDPQGQAKDILHKLDRSLAEAVKLYARQPLDFEPGTKWQYSNTGMATLGRIIEVVSGQPYEQFIESRILTPLGMKDTFFYPPAEKIERIALVYTHEGGKLKRAGPEALGGDPALYRKGAKYPCPECGLFSTAQDLSHFYQMMLSRGVYEGKRLLSPAAVQVMSRPQGVPGAWFHGARYGLGWEVIDEPVGTLTLLSIGSYGHGGAFGTHGWIDPKKDMLTVFLVGYTDDSGSQAEDAFQSMAGSAVLDAVE
jgi:CubicO group peptidase (beta-lactamase class C family)